MQEQLDTTADVSDVRAFLDHPNPLAIEVHAAPRSRQVSPVDQRDGPGIKHEDFRASVPAVASSKVQLPSELSPMRPSQVPIAVWESM